MLQVPFYLAFAKSDWPAVPCQWMRIIGSSAQSTRAFFIKNDLFLKATFSHILHTTYPLTYPQKSIF